MHMHTFYVVTYLCHHDYACFYVVTVKSIPHGCRLAFSQALKVALYKVVAKSGSVAAWVRLLLLP